MAFLEKFLQLWMGAARRCSWLAVIAFFAGAYVAWGYAFSTLTINTDTADMLDAKLEFQERADALNDAFPDAKFGLTVIVQASVADEAGAFARQLAEKLEPDKDHFQRVFSPTSDKFISENALLYLDQATLEARLAKLSKATGLIEALAAAPTAETLFKKLTEFDEPVRQSELGADTLQTVYAELAAVIEAENNNQFRPFSWERIVEDDSTEGRSSYLRFVEVLPVLEDGKVDPAESAIAEIRESIAELNAQFENRVDGYITGGPALRGEETRSVIRGVGLSLVLSIFFVSALLYFAFRSVFLTLLSLASLGITIVFTSAFAAFAVGELNLISIAFTVLLVGLALDFAIHLLLHVEERLAAGQSARIALNGSVHEVGPALAIAAPTTALAFFSFLPTSFSGIADLGLIAGGGVIIAFFVSITFLPAAIQTFPGLKARGPSGNVRRAFRVIDFVSVPVAILAIGLAVYSLRAIPEIRLDGHPMALRDPGSPSVRGYNLLFESEDGAPYVLTRLVSNRDAATKTADVASGLEVVGEVRSLPKLIPNNQDEKLELIDFAAAPLLFALEAHRSPVLTPGDTAAAAKAFLMQLETGEDNAARVRLRAALKTLLSSRAPSLSDVDRAIFRYWPDFVSRIDASFNADYIEDGALPEVLVEKYRSNNGFYRVDLLPADDLRSDAAIDKFIADVETAFPDIAGGLVQSKKAGAEVQRAMYQATGLALVVVLVVLFILIRQTKLVFFIMFPLIIAMILTLSVGAYLNVPLNFANVIVLPLLIGIGVDSGIHLVLRQRQVAAGEDVYGTSTSRAVLFSALTTVASFGSLIILSHRGLSSLGALLTIAIGATLVCMLIVLPALLKLSPINGDNGRKA
ncbi:MAG: MMPL family transporter [Marinicaulis sp.]|nr:MMPL family transporter [Marinicaulis sp.]